MNLTINCVWDKKTWTLFVDAPAEISEKCRRISLSNGNSVLTTLFTECGAAFGVCECRSKDDD